MFRNLYLIFCFVLILGAFPSSLAADEYKAFKTEKKVHEPSATGDLFEASCKDPFSVAVGGGFEVQNQRLRVVVSRPRDDLTGWKFRFRNTTQVEKRWARGWVVCAKPVKVPTQTVSTPSKPVAMPSKPVTVPSERSATREFKDCIWQVIGIRRTHAAENYPPFCPPGKVLRRIDFKGQGGPQITEVEKVECCALR